MAASDRPVPGAPAPLPPDQRRVGPVTFLYAGVSLFALKFLIDRLVARLLFDRDWSILNYLIPNEAYGLASLPPAERSFYLAMLAVALPFVGVGIVLTCRRLRDAGLSRWLALLFFVPAANLLFFAALSVIPSEGLKRREAEEERAAEPAITLAARAAQPVSLEYGHDDRTPSSRFFDAVMPRGRGASRALAILLPAPLAAGATLLAANFMRDYGWGLFVGMPFAVGTISAILYGYRAPRSLGECIWTAIFAFIAAAATLILCAIEGAGCLMMLAPLAIPVAVMGASLGYSIQSRPDRAGHANTLWAVTLTLPMMIVSEASFVPRRPVIVPVTTTVEVSATPEQVWPNVIAFGEIDAPLELIFRAGVAHPLRARIDGAGVGAIRYCEFSTGAFVEPIEVWDAPRRLRFAVTDNPPPMREWSPWRIAPPHLDNFLVSHGGQFELVALPGGRTRIEGTTWYEHRMWPRAYWGWWSDFLIHRIHTRVLEHVKRLSEASARADLRPS